MKWDCTIEGWWLIVPHVFGNTRAHCGSCCRWIPRRYPGTERALDRFTCVGGSCGSRLVRLVLYRAEFGTVLHVHLKMQNNN